MKGVDCIQSGLRIHTQENHLNSCAKPRGILRKLTAIFKRQIISIFMPKFSRSIISPPFLWPEFLPPSHCYTYTLEGVKGSTTVEEMARTHVHTYEWISPPKFSRMKKYFEHLSCEDGTLLNINAFPMNIAITEFSSRVARTQIERSNSRQTPYPRNMTCAWSSRCV
jgi:hypothetical protein